MSGLAARMVVLAALVVAQGDSFIAARRVSGAAPPLPGPQVVGQLSAVADVSVDDWGRVAFAAIVNATPVAGDLLLPALKQWMFKPALDGGLPVASHVLVAVLVRPAAVYDGPDLGEPPRKLETASPDLPVPLSMVSPKYPPQAVAEGSVVVEVEVGTDGRPSDARVLQGPNSFAGAAEEAARAWTFSPARRNGVPVPAVAYIIFGFRRPVV